MGDGGEKFHALLFLLTLPLNIFLQLPVCRAQAGQRIVELLRHFIQAGGQHTDFVFSVDFALPGHVQGGHPLCHVADTDQRLGVVPGTNHRPNDGDQQNHNGNKGDELQQDVIGLRHRDQGGIGKYMVGLPALLECCGTAHRGSRSVQVLHVGKIHGEQIIPIIIVDFHRGVVRHGKFHQTVRTGLPAIPLQNLHQVIKIGSDLAFQFRMVISRQENHHHAVNDNAADHQQRQHTEEGFGLDALTNLPSQFYIPPLSWFLCSPHPASCGCS